MITECLRTDQIKAALAKTTGLCRAMEPRTATAVPARERLLAGGGGLAWEISPPARIRSVTTSTRASANLTRRVEAAGTPSSPFSPVHSVRSVASALVCLCSRQRIESLVMDLVRQKSSCVRSGKCYTSGPGSQRFQGDPSKVQSVDPRWGTSNSVTVLSTRDLLRYNMRPQPP
jgi:hypothetical protein